MISKNIIWRLASLASLPYQERYVLSGTQDEYIVDVELLEDVDALQYLLSRPENRSQITDEQMKALEDLFTYIDANSTKAVSEVHSLKESEVWNTLRAKASTSLDLFGVSVDEMTAEEIGLLPRD